jgi:nicotinamidase/pyrazinamidase
LNRYAVERGIPAVSPLCAHSENDPEFRDWPAHCVLGTVGQQKPAALLAGQQLFEKQTTDVFATPSAEAFLAGLGAEEFVIYGVATEICVRFAALGLLQRGKRVVVVDDAIMHLDSIHADRFRTELKELGGGIATSADLCA